MVPRERHPSAWRFALAARQPPPGPFFIFSCCAMPRDAGDLPLARPLPRGMGRAREPNNSDDVSLR